ARLRARDGPRLGVRWSQTPGRVAAASSSVNVVASRDPSSTITSSRSENVWAATLSSACSSGWPASYTGMTTETRGASALMGTTGVRTAIDPTWGQECAALCATRAAEGGLGLRGNRVVHEGPHHVRRGPVGHDPSLMDPNGALAELDDRLRGVRDEQQGGAPAEDLLDAQYALLLELDVAH